ncbi:MAG: anti-sigma factor domain-containing protein [Acidimicrobiales bacterium]
MTHEDIAELLGAYALDAVDGDEAAEIEAHLADCPRCAAELAQHREVAALLANSGSDASVELWDRIAARLDPPGGPPPAATVLDAALAGALPRQITQRHRRARWSVVSAVGAVAAAVIALLAIQVGHLDHEVGQHGVAAAALAAQHDPHSTTVALASTAHPGTTAADIVVLPSGEGYVTQTRLPVLPADRTYQLWGVEQGRTVSLGVLGNHPGDVAFTQDDAATVSAYAVTAERAGGVVRSTHSPVAVGTVRGV